MLGLGEGCQMKGLLRGDLDLDTAYGAMWGRALENFGLTALIVLAAVLFTRGLNASTSRSLTPLRRRQFPLMLKIGSLTWRRSSMLWDVKMLLRQGEPMCFFDFPDCFRLFKTLCFFNYALMIRQDYDITSSLRRGALQFWSQSQNALQAMFPRIREEIREEFHTGSGSSNAGGNPPPVTIHTWLERFNKQKPHSFEKATAPVDAENWISHMEKIFDVMGCEDDFKTRLAVYKFESNALAWWKAYK
nr:zinc finger, CCHC-type, retrotransposon Gag domain protein [Tanacetum cinerariifolium]